MPVPRLGVPAGRAGKPVFWYFFKACLALFIMVSGENATPWEQ